MKTSKGRHGRHGPAFVLLQLKDTPSYGLAILKTMQEEMTDCTFDTAAVYRSLHALEEDGAVESFWDTSESGPARKLYRITHEGTQLLDEFRKDIEMRMRQLSYFLNKLNTD